MTMTTPKELREAIFWIFSGISIVFGLTYLVLGSDLWHFAVIGFGFLVVAVWSDPYGTLPERIVMTAACALGALSCIMYAPGEAVGNILGFIATLLFNTGIVMIVVGKRWNP